ncbi:MAG TPA: O-antigen ligase family protein [Thermoleophilia bacterium]|nr:O-antigen ligase family protein [Thermoleophilia bacterium]
MCPAGSTGLKDGRSLRNYGVWAAPLLVLFGVWLWLAVSSGGYLPRQWLPGALALGLFGLVIASLVAYPRRPRQLSLVVLGLFGLYSVWVAFSAVWAESTTRVWLEAGRTFSLLLVFALALLFFTDKDARRMFRYLLMAAVFGLLVVSVARLWSAADIAGLFFENRLAYPVSYPNNAAALYLVGFWPLMWLASGPEERAPVRGAALGLATALFGMAILTQSRGAIWSLAITLIIMFIVSPARIRMLLYLLVPALLMVYEFPNLNRYWRDGPEAVGGGLAGRTILVAAITAAFIGMILALLERWVKVSMRMKAIFGTIILLAAIGGAIYGSVVATQGAGGPFAWASDAWTQFTSPGAAPDSDDPSSGTGSRFAVVSSSGRVAIWKVAWAEFKDSPIVGVGADNFVFGYNRLRTTETYKPQQSHSIELQVLGETGIVGGVFAFGAALLALGGMLWPRCVAGWRGARETWLRRSKGSASPGEHVYRSRFCNARWGDRSMAYGWEMALFVGILFWLVHASVDWLWQMMGVAIPMLLLAAAGVSAVDARVDIMWPRWNRWLRVREETAGPNELSQSPEADEPVEPAHSAEEARFPVARRADHYLSRQRRRMKRRARRERTAVLLQPPGLLSHVFRALLITMSLVVIVGAGLPYLSIQYQNSALGIAKTDGVRAAKRAETAHWLQPADPGPYATQATIYTNAALAAAGSEAEDKAGAVLDNLSLSIGSFEEAISNEPADWSLRYRAGVAAINLMLASEYSAGRDPQINYTELIPLIPGLDDWTNLASPSSPLPTPGQAAQSLAADTETRRTAAEYRDMSGRELSQIAQGFLQEAKIRNPLASETAEAMNLVQGLQYSVVLR